MVINAYINFQGQCEEATLTYARIFKTDPPKLLKYGEMPGDPGFPLPEEAKNWVMHTDLNLQGSTVMFSDVPPGMPFVQGNNISLIVILEDRAEAARLFEALSEGGTVDMPLGETFFCKLYGSLVDMFGIGWQIHCDA